MLSLHLLVSRRCGMTEAVVLMHADVRVMQMNPPSGYTCLGYVAVVGYHNLSNTDAYWYCITYCFNRHTFKCHIYYNNRFGTPY